MKKSELLQVLQAMHTEAHELSKALEKIDPEASERHLDRACEIHSFIWLLTDNKYANTIKKLYLK